MGPPRMESDTAAKRRGSRRDGAEGRAGIEVRALISELHSPRRDRDRADHADGHSGPQSNRDPSELVALRRLGTVEDCAEVVEFLATDLSDYVTGAVIPIDGLGTRLIRLERAI